MRGQAYVSAPATRQSLGAILLFLGGFFVLLGAQEGCYQHAVALSAVVTEKIYVPAVSRIGSTGISSASEHKVRYRFTTPEGEERDGLSAMLLQHWARLREGDAVDIEYLPATGDSRVAKQTASAPVFLLIAAVLLGAGFRLRRAARDA